MKYLFKCTLFLFIFFETSGQTLDEKRIIGDMIDYFFHQCSNDSIIHCGAISSEDCLDLENSGIILLNETEKQSFNFYENSLIHLKENGLSLVDSAIQQDYIEKNRTSIKLDSIYMDGCILCTLSLKDLKKAIKNGNTSLRKKYGSKTIIQISRPGINITNDKALLSFTFTKENIGSVNIYYLLVNENLIWKVKESMMQTWGVYGN